MCHAADYFYGIFPVPATNVAHVDNYDAELLCPSANLNAITMQRPQMSLPNLQELVGQSHHVSHTPSSFAAKNKRAEFSPATSRISLQLHSGRWPVSNGTSSVGPTPYDGRGKSDIFVLRSARPVEHSGARRQRRPLASSAPPCAAMAAPEPMPPPTPAPPPPAAPGAVQAVRLEPIPLTSLKTPGYGAGMFLNLFNSFLKWGGGGGNYNAFSFVWLDSYFPPVPSSASIPADERLGFSIPSPAPAAACSPPP